MSVTNRQQQTINQFINAGLLFEIEPMTMRVAVTRLLNQDMLQSHARGVYRPGEKSMALTNQLRSWQCVRSKTKIWEGGWLAIYTHHLGRTDRKKLRRQDRALNLNGYATVYSGLTVRPDNLIESLDQHRQDLLGLGLDKQAVVTQICKTALPEEQDWTALWPSHKLDQSYIDAINTMQKSLLKIKNMSLSEAARETLLVGESVIRVINFDPLLPTQVRENSLFEEMFDQMLDYNQYGIECWSEYLDENNA